MDPFGLFSTVSKYALIGVAAVGILGGAFYGGYAYRGEQDANARVVAAATTTRTVVKQAQVGVAQQVTVYQEDLTKVRQLEADKAALNLKIKNLQEAVKLYVPENNVGTYLSPCTVSLLNAAAASTDGAKAENSAATLAACYDTGASSLTWQQFVEDEIDLRGRYNAARDQSNALIEWVDKNVVNAPVDGAPSNEPSKTAPEH